MSPVPLAICREILLRLPAEPILRFRAVCKQWRAAIDEPCFAEAHIDNQLSSNNIIIRNYVGPPFHPLYHFNLDDLNFTDAQQTIPATPLTLARGGLSRLKNLHLSACNGLMLITPGQGRWEIWNASTGERLILPVPIINLKVVGMGLGYDCGADDYRVVVIDGEFTRRTHVYSLKSDTWREIGDCPFGLLSRQKTHGVYLNGALHWLSWDGDIIIAFDFATEKYRQLLSLPPKSLQMSSKSMQLEAFGGCLFLSYIGEEDRIDRNNFKYYEDTIDKQKYFDAWVMNDYGTEDSWIKLFSLKEYYFSFDVNNIKLVAYKKNKNQVLMQHGDCFIWFDVGSNSVKMVEIHGLCNYKISAQIYIESILRLHDSCGRVASEIRKTKRGTIRKPDTKLTFCVRDFEQIARRKAPRSHYNCYNIDSNWYTYSCQGEEIHTASSDPDSHSSIPLDICREIFLHVPAKSLIRFRAVCKAYQAIIDEPCFVRAHTNNQPVANTILIENSSGPPFYPLYSFDLDDLYCTDDLQRMPATPLSFMHSRLSYLSASVCNGLILIVHKKLELWNPLTGECLQLPRGEFNSDITASGLWYDYASDDYKVVCIDRFPPQDVEEDVSEEHEWEEYVHRTHVYSLRSDTWRMVGNCPLDDNTCGPDSPGVPLCGALHWTAWEMNKIIALDLKTENYSQLQWPPMRRRIYCVVDDQRYLEVLGGCLVMIDLVGSNHGDDNYMDVWVMKDYGAEDSWINVFSINDCYISFGRNIKPVAFMENESRILLQDNKGLILYDGESDSMKKCNIHGLTRCSYARAFSGSIFRLHDNCGVGRSGSFTRQRTRIKKRQMEISDTELYLCLRNVSSWIECESHENCHRLDSNWCCSSSGDEDEDELDDED